MATDKMKIPRWTVGYNLNTGDFVGTGWCFFVEEEDADEFYKCINERQDCSGFKRPFFPGDEAHLGACHQELAGRLRVKTAEYRTIIG